MTGYGNYEPLTMIGRSNLTSVVKARRVGEETSNLAMKILEPRTEISGNTLFSDDVAVFLQRARTQQQIAMNGARHIAPIHDCGSSPMGTWYVTDVCDRSLKELIESHYRISPQVLHSICVGILAGLREMRDLAGRPHGNLKASNVLVPSLANVRETPIILTDPLSKEEATSQTQVTDFIDFGAIIYSLVTLQTYDPFKSWPIEMSSDWDRLGGKKRAWFDFCCLLLNPDNQSSLTIESIEIQLRKVSGGGLVGKVAKGLLVLLVVAGLLAAGFFLARLVRQRLSSARPAAESHATVLKPQPNATDWRTT